MLSAAERKEAAEALLAAARDHAVIPPISVTYPAAEVEDAYRISQAVAEGSVIPTERLFQPLAEAELAFVLREPLVGPSVNAADVVRATDFILPCIEIVDRRFSDRGVLEQLGLLSHFLAVTTIDRVAQGKPHPEPFLAACRRLGARPEWSVAFEDSATGVASAVMGNPINAVAWLANKLHSFGVPLEAGHVVLSGSFIKAIRFGPGDVMVADFTGLGMVQFAVAR